MAKVEICCGSCRKSKPVPLSRDESVCKHRDLGFTVWGNKPCENWLPGKDTVRIALMREAKEGSELPESRKCSTCANNLSRDSRNCADCHINTLSKWQPLTGGSND
jgi:hypothetical protein